jgi:hypothetical protein
MLARGLYRLCARIGEPRLVSQLRQRDLLPLKAQLGALAEAGRQLGWRAMIESRSTLDVVSNRFVLGRWLRIFACMKTANGLQVLRDMPVLPVGLRRGRT